MQYVVQRIIKIIDRCSIINCGKSLYYFHPPAPRLDVLHCQDQLAPLEMAVAELQMACMCTGK